MNSDSSNDQPTGSEPAITPPDLTSGGAPRLSRRAALRTWVTHAAPLVLLAACSGPGSLVGRAQAAPAQPASDRTAQSGQSAASQAGSSQPASVQSGAAQQSLPACVITPEQTEGP